MNLAGLSLDQSPPLSVPGPYFAAAPLFAVAAGLLLAWEPAAFQSRWSPASLALTHLLTLGFLAMVMTGAFQQLLPVLAGSPVPRARWIGVLVFLSLVVGTVALAWGVAVGDPVALLAAMVSLGIGVALFVAAAAWSLWGSRSTHATIHGMGTALSALLVTVGLGLHLAMGHAQWAPLARELTDLHAGWGLLGWIALLVMSVAYQVVPMFQITPDYPRPMLRLLVPSLFVLLLAWSAAGVLWPSAQPWIAALAAAGVAWFGITTLRLQARRRRALADVTVDFWRLALGALLTALAVWGLSVASGRPPPDLVLGILFVAGFAVSVVSGMLYKIVPFLVWLHLNNRLFVAPALRGRIPNMKQVIAERRARWHWRVHILALVLLLGAAAHGGEALVRVAGLAFAAASALLAYNLWSAFALYARLLREAARSQHAASAADV